MISFINPRNTIRQIAQNNNMGELQIRKIVYSLLQAGVVEVIRPPRPVAAPGRGKAGEREAAGKSAKMRRPDVKRGIVQRLIGRIREL